LGRVYGLTDSSNPSPECFRTRPLSMGEVNRGGATTIALAEFRAGDRRRPPSLVWNFTRYRGRRDPRTVAEGAGSGAKSAVGAGMYIGNREKRGGRVLTDLSSDPIRWNWIDADVSWVGRAPCFYSGRSADERLSEPQAPADGWAGIDVGVARRVV